MYVIESFDLCICVCMCVEIFYVDFVVVVVVVVVGFLNKLYFKTMRFYFN